MKIEDKITKEKIEKYFSLTKRALKEVKKNIISSREEDAKEIIEMTQNYISDAEHFYKKGDMNYADVRVCVREMRARVRFPGIPRKPGAPRL